MPVSQRNEARYVGAAVLSVSVDLQGVRISRFESGIHPGNNGPTFALIFVVPQQ